MNIKLTLGSVLFDLEKSFDCINHNIFFYLNWNSME
jgi:hypothetical protein